MCNKNRIRRIGVLVFILILYYGSLFAAVIQTVAVIPFDDNVISSAEATALSDIFENRLAQTGSFELVERKRIENLMKELNFGTSGFVDQSAAVKAGKILSAQWLVLGSVSKLGKEYSVNVKIVNTESGRIVTGASGEGKDIIQIKRVVEDIAKKLSKQLLTDFIWSFDVSGLMILQEMDVHSIGVNIGFTYNITKNLSVGPVGGVLVRAEDSALKMNLGGKFVIGDPRHQALVVTLSTFPSVGFIYRNFLVEVTPLMFLGVENSIGISIGYSLAN